MTLKIRKTHTFDSRLSLESNLFSLSSTTTLTLSVSYSVSVSLTPSQLSPSRSFVFARSHSLFPCLINIRFASLHSARWTGVPHQCSVSLRTPPSTITESWEGWIIGKYCPRIISTDVLNNNASRTRRPYSSTTSGRTTN
jgi:hypothetical protein